MMKVSSMNRSPISSGYEDYFDAFVEKKTYSTLKEDAVEEDGFNQALPYFIFLITPIFIVLLVAASRLH